MQRTADRRSARHHLKSYAVAVLTLLRGTQPHTQRFAFGKERCDSTPENTPHRQREETAVYLLGGRSTLAAPKEG